MDNKTPGHPLQQNPHALRELKENKLEVAIGRQIRFFRKQWDHCG